MSRFRTSRHHAADDRREPPVEDQAVRQYRFLLRTAPADAVEAAHVEALPRLAPAERQAVLTAVQRGLVAGQRLGADDIAPLGHLIVLGERRTPNAFLAACEHATLVTLSQAVIDSDTCFGLFGRYADWDGLDPEPEDDSAWAAGGFNPDSGRWNPARGTGRDNSGLVPGAGGAWGGGDGGGGGG